MNSNQNGPLDDTEHLLGGLLVEGTRTDPARARAEIKKLMKLAQKKPDSQLRFYLARAKRILKGMPNPNAILANAERRLARLSRKAQAVLRAKSFGECLHNDSIESYLDASGKDCRLACEGLQELGLKTYAITLKRLSAEFRAEGKKVDLWSFVEKLPGRLRRDVRLVDRNGHRIVNAALDYAQKHPAVFE
jgi:hypothetical protein